MSSSASTSVIPGISSRALLLTVLVLTIICVWVESPTALFLFAVDGLPALIILAIATLAGLPIANSLSGRSGDRWWTLIVALGLGLGLVSTAILVLGVIGCLQRWIVLLVLVAMTVPGLLVVRKLVPASNKTDDYRDAAWRWCWILVVPSIVLIIIVSVAPPGVLWQEEGNGYDVLEYHLQLPREYLHSGQIDYVPHNVYANFPANAEMLYLLSMLLVGDVYAGAASAKILNALIGVACVATAYMIGRRRGQNVGVVTGVLAATTGWLVYLSGIAYVENLLLLFGFVAAGALMRAFDPRDTQSRVSSRELIVAGLLAGFACGCKYTGVVMIALPVVAALAMIDRGWSQRLRSMFIVGASALLAFSPWLIKNAAMTGNPVFPLLHQVFEAHPEGWGSVEADHFADSHNPGPDESVLSARIALTWRHILADPHHRFGPMLFILAAWRLTTARRSRLDIALAAMAIVQLLVWFGLTHLYARFAIPLMIPLVLLGGRVVDGVRSRSRATVLIAILVAGGLFNATQTWRLYREHYYVEGQRVPWDGATAFFLTGQGGGHEHLAVLNATSFPEDAKVLMVGDAKAFYVKPDADYCVVFNRNPFVTAIREAESAKQLSDWLRERGYTHIFVHWSEIARLRGSRYGFPKEVTPDVFLQLSQHGWDRTHVFSTGDPPIRYGELYTFRDATAKAR